jgi:F0F1-type ATP synthase assembly protein I
MDKDFLKEKVSLLKLWITLFAAIIVGSAAWLVDNWRDYPIIFDIITITMVIVLIATVITINRKAYKIIKELKR